MCCIISVYYENIICMTIQITIFLNARLLWSGTIYLSRFFFRESVEFLQRGNWTARTIKLCHRNNENTLVEHWTWLRHACSSTAQQWTSLRHNCSSSTYSLFQQFNLIVPKNWQILKKQSDDREISKLIFFLTEVSRGSRYPFFCINMQKKSLCTKKSLGLKKDPKLRSYLFWGVWYHCI